MKDRTLHMIGNAHIDPVWLWQWPEGLAEVRATFRSALDRMNEYPEFLFTADSAAYYAWIEEIDPAMFEEIRARVREGRWEIVGGWWVEPDCNLPSGESFVRHALYAQRFFRDRFGRTATIGFNVDPFGHSGMLPQLLRRAGMHAYVFMRPGPHEMQLPAPLFWWESADGSRVLGLRLPHEYCSPREDLANHLEKSVAQLPADWTEFLCFYGVGNHGGGPTRENLESIRRLDQMGQMPRLLHSTATRFFERINGATDSLPVVRDDLQHHAVGCYAAHSGIKRWMRRAESLLVTAEAWAAVAERHVGRHYPAAELGRAWKSVLFNQFHDILAGTSIEPAYDEARDELGEASAIAARALNAGIQSIARRIALPVEQGSAPILAFNPHPWPVRTVVELEFGGLKGTDGLTDEATGAPIALQETQSYATASDWRKRMAFDAELPPLGYRTFRVRPGVTRPAESPLLAGDTYLENDHVRLDLDAVTGAILSLVDRESGIDLAGPPARRAIVLEDTTDTWSHRALAYREQAGAFEWASVRLVESGPVRAIVRVESRYGLSSLVEDFVLGAWDGAIEVRVILDWHEEARLLKLRFPTALEDVAATYEIPYGTIERPANGEEEPGQRWVDVSGTTRGGGRAGLAVLNDGKYSFDVDGGSIGVTAVRSPIYAHHDPTVPRPGVRYQFQDQGQQRFTLALLPHSGDWRTAGLSRRAALLNQRPVTLLESMHEGSLASFASFVSVEPDNVVLGAVKGAEDPGGDLVVRLVECAGRAATAIVRLPAWGHELETEIGPYEVRTFRVDGSGRATEVDLVEWPLEPAAASETAGVAPERRRRRRVRRS